jgi:hypothetical protein
MIENPFSLSRFSDAKIQQSLELTKYIMLKYLKTSVYKNRHNNLIITNCFILI